MTGCLWVRGMEKDPAPTSHSASRRVQRLTAFARTSPSIYSATIQTNALAPLPTILAAMAVEKEQLATIPGLPHSDVSNLDSDKENVSLQSRTQPEHEDDPVVDRALLRCVPCPSLCSRLLLMH